LAENIVTARRGVSGNVTQSPDGLLADIWLRAAQELDEDWYRARLDNHLCLLSTTAGNVCERPCCLKLHKGMWGSEEFDEAADHAGLNDFLNGRVSFLGEEFPEFGGGLNLSVDLVREDSFDHFRQLGAQL
jgi:hypothetical protein